ncbi:MAG: alpha/beta hydrolase [Acidimicrobiia bacterium]|nr:alpha/beta hydrolase [Acidimicrobiia bacterium]
MNPTPDPVLALGVIGRAEARLTPTLVHHELYTYDGLLTLHWHGDPTARHVVIACGGAIGGTLGPGRAVYAHLGQQLAAAGIGTIRVGYRRPNDIERCVHDMAAAAELASRHGAERFVTIGHSFGGAPAIQAGVMLGERAAGVVTLATQTAGCEPGEALAGRTPTLHVHGTADTVLPYMASQMVQMLTEGEVRLLPGASHSFAEAADELEAMLGEWVPARFDT